jgi:hypothetical protein
MDRVTLANMALQRIGEQTIMSFDEESKNAKTCALLYQPVLEQVLRAHNWTCATFRRELARLTDAPVFGFANAYRLPEDPRCLRVIRTNDVDEFYRIEGRKLLTDNDRCAISYIGWIEDSNDLEPLCAKVFYLALAVEMSYTMTETNTVLNGLYDQLKQAWAEARQMDSHEGSSEFIEASGWLNSRLAGLGYNYDRTKIR